MQNQYKGALGFGYGPCHSTSRKNRLEALQADMGLEYAKDVCPGTVWQNAKSQTRRIKDSVSALAFLSNVQGK